MNPERAARRSALLDELARICRAVGIEGHDVSQTAPNLTRLLAELVPDSAGPEAALAEVLEHLAQLEDVECEEDDGPGIPGIDWADILRMNLNIDREPRNLGDRQRQYQIPASVAAKFNCLTPTSSRFRNLVVGSALGVLVDLMLDSAERKRIQNRAPASVKLKSERTYLRTLRNGVRSALAAHGLDDKDWALAISAQYFLCLLARELGLTERADYLNLLNRFLASFTYRVDDSLVLNPEHILVTPEETERIREAMIREDERDPYFARSGKTRAQNVNTDALHLNYLNGLALAITASGESSIIGTVRHLAMEHLLDAEATGQILDVEGGWQPYRIPWLTARVLISFAEVPSDIIEMYQADDKIRDAVTSLVERINPATMTWRSGVGDWVTEWESTGLCLEALLRWPQYSDSEFVAGVVASTASRRADWLVVPDLNSESSANATLAAVIVASVLLGAMATQPQIAQAIEPAAKIELLAFLSASMDAVQTALVPQARQFCTVPQVLYYAARVGSGRE